ncbi:unnamed protein product [Allacma fusca]|uniref:DRBM domain-containing protein n=1 Tax=Allacma fusca TaxID=39272 RepID=A0A8J2J111_9HEXA|nr:unnamed protein product [Allacma fusca]
MTSSNEYIRPQSGSHYKSMQSHDVIGMQPNKNIALIMSQGEISSAPMSQDLSLFANNLVNPFGQRKANAARENAPSHCPTPVSVLNELCSKAKVAPRFEFTENGPVHNRRYECQVSVDSEGQGTEVKATGVGKTKKDAKQDAAKSLLLTLDARLIDKFDVKFTKKEEVIQPEYDPEAPGNPVGELNEFCLRAKKIVPEYEDEREEGQPHERVFTVTCKLGPKLIERGRGRSKKQAKRVAAYKMLQRIMYKNAADVFQAYRGRSGKQLDVIRNENIHTILKSVEPLRLLRGIVEEQSLKVEWMDLQGSVDESKANTLLTIGVDPMFVFFGSGENRQKSKNDAAENALQFLRHLMKN